MWVQVGSILVSVGKSGRTKTSSANHKKQKPLQIKKTYNYMGTNGKSRLL